MSIKFKVPLNLVGLTTDPGSAANGDLYFNTTTNKVRYYTNSAWQDLGAAAGGASVQVSTTIPNIATEGKLWYDNDDARLYVYDGTYWVEVSIGPMGPQGPSGPSGPQGPLGPTGAASTVAGPTGAVGPGVAIGGTVGQYLTKSTINNYETSWSTLAAASLTSTDVSRLTGATSNLQTQINTLSTNLGNTLDDYVPIGDVGVADGVASLDSSGKVPIAQLGNLIDGAPAALDTLNELAAAINDDASYAATITTALGLKAPIASPTFTGTVTIPSGASISGYAPIESPTFTGTVGGISKSMVGLGNVDNTTDALKPVSTATQTSLDNKVSKAGGDIIQASADTVKPLILKGFSVSQAQNMLEIQSNSAVVNAAFKPNGSLYTGSAASAISARVAVSTNTSNNSGIIVRGVASQTANLQEWQNSDGTVLAKITPIGQIINDVAGAESIIIRNSGNIKFEINQYSQGWSNTSFTFGNYYNVDSGTLPRLSVFTSGAGQKGAIIRGSASQTSNLQEWQNSAGTVLSSVNAAGLIRVNNTNTDAMITSTGNATYDAFRFRNSSGLIFWGVGSNNNIFYSNYGSFSMNGGNWSGGRFNVDTGAADSVGIMVRGQASQTGNLQEWQNSSGTVLGNIGSGGSFDFQVGGHAITSYNEAQIMLRLFAPSGQTANIQNWYVNGTIVSSIGAAGNISILLNSASTIGLIVKGAASQTANLQQWQNSAGTVLSKVDASGAMFTITPADSTNTTQVATTAYVKNNINNLINSAPGTLDTLGEIATALAASDSASAALVTSVNLKAPIASPTFTGTVTLPNSTVTNAMLSNSSITINGSAVSLGGSATIAAGLTPVAVSTNITMVKNTRYFVDTTSDLTLTLPATPSLGDEIELYDAKNNAFTNDVVILRNGEKINGLTDDAALDINGFTVSFIYTGSTYGWRMK